MTDNISPSSKVLENSGMIWEPTATFRFVRQSMYTYNSKGDADGQYFKNILQQMWVAHTGKTEWRDVPMVDG